MFEFKHPKYYKELRKRNKSDQAISYDDSTESQGVRPDPGLKLPDSTMVKQRASSSTSRGQEQQASSVKPQAPEETSDKRQAPSNKHQA